MYEVTVGNLLGQLGLGMLQTLKLLPLCIGLTLAFGVLIGSLQTLRLPLLNSIITVYVFVMRGVPPLLVLMILFFAANIADAFLTAIIGLSFYHTAYISEIVRGGIEAIPKGQFEAAHCLGLSTFQTLRKVVLPQIWYQTLPAIAGQYILLVKDTSLVSVVGMQDIMRIGKQLMQVAADPLIVYFFIGVFYYVICTSLQQVSAQVERGIREKYWGGVR